MPRGRPGDWAACAENRLEKRLRTHFLQSTLLLKFRRISGKTGEIQCGGGTHGISWDSHMVFFLLSSESLVYVQSCVLETLCLSRGACLKTKTAFTTNTTLAISAPKILSSPLIIIIAMMSARLKFRARLGQDIGSTDPRCLVRSLKRRGPRAAFSCRPWTEIQVLLNRKANKDYLTPGTATNHPACS